jgi:hypothetical protein
MKLGRLSISLEMLIACGFLTGCSGKAPANLSLNSTQLQKIIRQKKYTVLFFWTSWCSVSKQIIPKTYLAIADSVSRNHIDANLVLLCGSPETDSTVKGLNIPGLQSYYIAPLGNGFPFTDRMKIKKYIHRLFPEYDFKQLKGLSYGIPVTLIVDKNMQVVNPNGAQDVKSLLRTLTDYYKKK